MLPLRLSSATPFAPPPIKGESAVCSKTAGAFCGCANFPRCCESPPILNPDGFSPLTAKARFIPSACWTAQPAGGKCKRKTACRRRRRRRADFALVGDGEGFIHAFNSSDGAAVARINLDASAIIFIAALGDSDSPRFIAQTSRGGIFMVELRALDS